MPARIKAFLQGHSFPQEYLCTDKDQLHFPLHVFIGKRNVTDHHLFLGYQPLLIGFVSSENMANILEMRFCSGNDTDKPVACIKLKLLKTLAHGNSRLFLFTGIDSNHSFINLFYRVVNGFPVLLRSLKRNNIRLKGNLYNQVRIAYSIPRAIQVISVGQNGMFNMFPTDLFGKADEETLVISLRISSKACAQVMKHRKIALAEVHRDTFREVYAMGKNHTKDLQPKKIFTGTAPTRNDQLPLLSGTLGYLELDYLRHEDFGIHRLLFFNICGKQQLWKGPSLAHIHCYSAMWLQRQGFPLRIYIR